MYCVASTEKAQRFQTDLHLRDRNATMTSDFGGSSFMDLLMQSAHSDLDLVVLYHFTSELFLANFLDWRCVADEQSISQQSNLRSDSVVSPLWCLNDVEKWKGCNDSGRKYRSYWEMTFIWVQKAADGSVCKLSHYCTQSVQSHKPWKVWEVSAIMSSSPQHNAKRELILSQFRRHFLIFL